MVVRDDEPKLVVECLGNTEGLRAERHAFIEPPELSERTGEPGPGVRRGTWKRSRRVGREFKGKRHDAPSEELLGGSMVTENRMRLAHRKARILLEVRVADLRGNRERAAANLGRSLDLTRHAEGRTEE
jgi:hypothetical protein